MSAGGDAAGDAARAAAGEQVPWWAFWRRRPRSGPADPGLPSSSASAGPATARRAARVDDADEEDRHAQPRVTPFSGASPDAGLYALPELADAAATDGPLQLDAVALTGSADRVEGLVAAVLAGDTATVHGALAGDGASAAAAVSATAALAARLPVLSGVTGPAAVVDEDPGDLLRAYGSLLATRCEPYRVQLAPAVSREQLADVAQAAAAAAQTVLEQSPTQVQHAQADDLVPWCTTDLPVPTQLVAACLLLAQTCQDGGGSVTRIPREIERLFA